jgi:hypothetical protein
MRSLWIVPVLPRLGHGGRRLAVTLCLAAIILIACTVSLVSLALAATTTNFPDVPNSHPYFLAIRELASQGVIGGYANGNFGPDDPVTRQQFAKMIVGAGGYPVSETDICPFTDVDKGGPATFFPDNFVAVCAAHGITTGKTATTFDPSGKITRYQVISMVVRAVKDLLPGLLAAPPADFVGTWSSDPTHGANADLAEANALLSGLDMSADPRGNATRGEVAQVLHNLFGAVHYWSNHPRVVYYYGLNTNIAPLDDVNVRKALALAIDRQAICNGLQQTGRVPATDLVPPSIPGYDSIKTTFFKTTAQVDRAKALLATAGHANGVGLPEITIKVNPSPMHSTVANLVKDQWKAIGVNATVRVVEWGDFFAMLDDPSKVTVYAVGIAAEYNDAYEFLNIFRSGADNNFAGWSNAAYDQALDASLLAATEQDRLKVYADLEKMLIEDQVPVIPVYWY